MAESDDLPPPPALASLSGRGPLALFLDFDGTLVEIAETPDAISVPDDLAQRVERLAERLDGRLALVSGRALDDLEGHLGKVALYRAGSHGADCLRADGSTIGHAAEALPDEVVRHLRAFAADNGLDYEEKSHGGALHFRRAPELREAAETMAGEVAEAHGLDIKRGKGVCELVHPGADKGAALAAFMDEAFFSGALPIFVGDDLTDEDGFEAASARGGFGIVVGTRTPTAARYRLSDVQEVHTWLTL